MTPNTLTSGNVTLTVTEAGIVSLTLGGGELIAPAPAGTPPQGLYRSGAFADSFDPGTPEVAANPIMVSGRISTMRTYANCFLSTAYSLAPNGDVIVSYVVYNNSSVPMESFSLSLPTFVFGPNATGKLKQWPVSYLLSNPQDAFHPGTWSPHAASYVKGNCGICFHSPTHFDKPSLFNLTNSDGQSQSLPTFAAASFHAKDPIAPGNHLIVKITIHLSPTTDIPSVTGSYVADFQKFAGPTTLYSPDQRAWIQGCNPASSWITPDNPLGYGPGRRFDLASGIAAYQQMISPQIGLSQGVMFWQPQGWNLRGEAWREDIDCWPPAVQANLPALFKWMAANNLKVGISAQPGLIVTSQPGTWGIDYSIQRDARNASQMASLFARIRNVMALGVSALYCDSFGGSLNDYQIMKQIRAAFPDLLTYSEQTSDLMLPLSGMYAQLYAPDGSTAMGNLQLYDAETMEIFRLLYPQRSVMLKTPLAYGTVQNYVEDWHASPLIFDSDSGLANCTALAQGVTAGLTPTYQWKD